MFLEYLYRISINTRNMFELIYQGCLNSILYASAYRINSCQVNFDREFISLSLSLVERDRFH